MNILLIEDSPIDLAIIKSIIHKANPSITIETADNGAKGLALIKRGMFDCIFIDYRLPDINGIEILKKIYNAQTDLPPYPTIILTGDSDRTIFKESMKYGAQDYLRKDNISPDIMLFAIEKARYTFKVKLEKHDISQKYEHSQKIEAIGQLTGGIAHDFNNLLTVILGNTQLLSEYIRRKYDDDQHCQKKLKTVQRAAQKGADLVQHLMTFSRHRNMAHVRTNINDTITKMQDLMVRTIGQTAQIHNDLDDTLWACDIDPFELELLIINMSANARDAMPDGGIITIKTKNTPLNMQEAQRLNLPEGPYICLSISDTGTGIPDNIKDKIFTPFFTTKEIGKGTGLGMSISHNFVQNCKGAIDVISTPRQGTTFDIYLPQSTQETTIVKEEEQELNIVQAHETILITEDENDILELAITILENNSYKILKATNAQQAIDILANPDTHIDLLFTDIIMPGDMNGVQLAIRALVLRPDIKILFTTGFIKSSIPDIKLLDEYTVLNKPYQKNELLHTVQTVLKS